MHLQCTLEIACKGLLKCIESALSNTCESSDRREPEGKLAGSKPVPTIASWTYNKMGKGFSFWPSPLFPGHGTGAEISPVSLKALAWLSASIVLSWRRGRFIWGRRSKHQNLARARAWETGPEVKYNSHPHILQNCFINKFKPNNSLIKSDQKVRLQKIKANGVVL